MPKHYKEMMDEIINKMDEDAPANAVAHGGVDMNPNGKKKKKDILICYFVHTIYVRSGIAYNFNMVLSIFNIRTTSHLIFYGDTH